jgi:hypothetical protein
MGVLRAVQYVQYFFDSSVTPEILSGAVTVSKYFRVSGTRSMRDKGLEGRKFYGLPLQHELREPVSPVYSGINVR